jgi:hypothetical protein
VLTGADRTPPSIASTGAVRGGGASSAGLVAPRTPSPLGAGAVDSGGIVEAAMRAGAGLAPSAWIE